MSGGVSPAGLLVAGAIGSAFFIEIRTVLEMVGISVDLWFQIVNSCSEYIRRTAQSHLQRYEVGIEPVQYCLSFSSRPQGGYLGA